MQSMLVGFYNSRVGRDLSLKKKAPKPSLLIGPFVGGQSRETKHSMGHENLATAFI